MSQARTFSELLGMGAENARVVLEAFTNAFGKQGTRQLLESAAPPRSPIQDAMNKQQSIGMGVREIAPVPGQAPKPQFGPGTTTRPQPVEVPMGGTRPRGSYSGVHRSTW